MRKIVLLLFVFALMLPRLTWADTAINAAGAAALKTQVEEELQWRNNMVKIFGQGLASDGKTEVTPKGDSYEIKFPHLSMLAGKEGKLDIGTVVVKAVPDKTGAWLMQVTLPSTMTFYDAANAPQVQITIGSQHFSTTWLQDKQIYPAMDSLFQNVQFKGIGGKAITANISVLKSLINFKDNGDGTWSGPADFEASGIAVTVPGANPVTIDIGKIASHNTYDRLNMSEAVKMQEAAEKFLKAGLPQTDKEKQAFLTKFMTKSPVAANGIGINVEADKFLLHDSGVTPDAARPESKSDAAHPQSKPVRQIAFDRLDISGITSNTQQEKSQLVLKTSLDGLQAPFISPPMADLLPHQVNIEVTLDNLPTRKMVDVLFAAARKSAQTAETMPDPVAAKKQEKTEMAAATALLPRMFQEAGASISVQNTFAKSAAIEASLAGRIDTSAATAATGKMALSFKGMDEFIRGLQDSLLKPGADPRTLGYLVLVTSLQAKGQPDKAADGKSLRNYVVELKPDGKILLNGTDVAAPRPAGQNKATTQRPHTMPMMPAPMRPAPTMPALSPQP